MGVGVLGKWRRTFELEDTLAILVYYLDSSLSSVVKGWQVSEVVGQGGEAARSGFFMVGSSFWYLV